MRVKEIRRSQGITAAELADGIGVTRRTIANWENGDTSPTLNDLYKMCVYLECSIYDLIGDDETEESEGGEQDEASDAEGA